MKSNFEEQIKDGYANVNGVELHYVEAGKGPLILLLHGFPDYWYTWRHQIPVLAAAGFHVVALDMRGYNLSSKPIGIQSYRLEVLCKDIEQFISHFGVKTAYIVGHDWGGGVAWGVSVLFPDKVKKLVVLNCPHPLSLLEGFKTFRQLRKSWYMFFFLLPKFPELKASTNNYALLRKIFEKSLNVAFSEKEMDQHIQAMAKPGVLTSSIHYYRALFRMTQKDRKVLKRRIDTPILVIWGDKDLFLGKELAKPKEIYVANAKVRHFPEGGHWIHHDLPQEVNDLIIDFLK